MTCEICSKSEVVDDVMNCESCGAVICTECNQPDTEDIPLCPDCHDKMMCRYAWDRRPNNTSFY